MGCASSNQSESKENAKSKVNGNAKGGVAGMDGGDAAPEPVVPKQNPYMSLTPKDVFSLKMSWKGIRRCLEETGCFMFQNMFESKPETKKYFEKFKDMSNELLFKSNKFIDHANSVMESFDTIVTELDDADKTHQNIKKFGADHKRRNVPDQVLSDMRDPFLKAVENTLGDRYTDRMRNIYEIFIDYFIKTMKEGYAT